MLTRCRSVRWFPKERPGDGSLLPVSSCITDDGRLVNRHDTLGQAPSVSRNWWYAHTISLGQAVGCPGMPSGGCSPSASVVSQLAVHQHNLAWLGGLAEV